MRHTALTLSILGTAGAIDASSATPMHRYDVFGQRIERKIDKTDAVLTLIEGVSRTTTLVTGTPSMSKGTVKALTDAGYTRLNDDAYRAHGDTLVFYNPEMRISAFLVRAATGKTNVIAMYGQPSVAFRSVPLNTPQ